jgi:hypothetical protein
MLLATSATMCPKLRGSPVISAAALAAGDEWREISYDVSTFISKTD